MKKRIEDLAYLVVLVVCLFMLFGIPMLIAMGIFVLAKIAFFVALVVGVGSLLTGMLSTRAHG